MYTVYIKVCSYTILDGTVLLYTLAKRFAREKRELFDKSELREKSAVAVKYACVTMKRRKEGRRAEIQAENTCELKFTNIFLNPTLSVEYFACNQRGDKT